LEWETRVCSARGVKWERPAQAGGCYQTYSEQFRRGLRCFDRPTAKPGRGWNAIKEKRKQQNERGKTKERTKEKREEKEVGRRERKRGEEGGKG